MTQRRLSNRTRFLVLSRDGFRCSYCGASRDDGVRLEVDHVIPVSDGGQDDPDNLVTACYACNRGKFDRAPDLSRSDDSTDWMPQRRGICRLAVMFGYATYYGARKYAQEHGIPVPPPMPGDELLLEELRASGELPRESAAILGAVLTGSGL